MSLARDLIGLTVLCLVVLATGYAIFQQHPMLLLPYFGGLLVAGGITGLYFANKYFL